MARLFWNIAQASDIPRIPDFEILNRIGGGAYGEVYLARSVTGKYRAVKVVRREDFEYERTFEREFEGIQRYEGVSHSHPGLVDILHVGRDREAGFYYYVMELADDESGEEVDLASGKYKPRTLSSDLRRGKARTVRECVDLGMTIAGALGHLHHVGLIHRDVKPSNIIFVKGVPKLADVGLVASTGQRTYVGTEGYVPPEGPGTSAADLYSLAMVLYEMHTGKDRLDFPELPTNLEIPPSVNRDEWRSLNTVICRAGSPDPRKRYESAFAFAKALREITPVSWKAPEPRRGGVGGLLRFCRRDGTASPHWWRRILALARPSEFFAETRAARGGRRTDSGESQGKIGHQRLRLEHADRSQAPAAAGSGEGGTEEGRVRDQRGSGPAAGDLSRTAREGRGDETGRS